MKILKVGIGNSKEAFVENRFLNGLNIISSDDNNKGKTIVIQSMMYALGNEPTFPASFEYQNYTYYVEFEEKGRVYQICRTGNGFVLKQDSILQIFGSVSELKRYWNDNIFPLPSIVKNQILRIVDPVLFMQISFVGQDKKDTFNIANHSFYNKQDFIEMLYAYVGLGAERLSQEKIVDIKREISKLRDERRLLLQQHKILKSQKLPVAYLSMESDRLAFSEKINNLEKVQSRILDFRKLRNVALVRKNKWEQTIQELNSLNRTISCGQMRCMDCGSTNISLSVDSKDQMSYAFDVSTVEMRKEIINSISKKISAYDEEIEQLTKKIEFEQKNLQELMRDEKVSLESIVAYKKDIFSASDAEDKIQEIDSRLSILNSQLITNENSIQDNKERRADLFKAILRKMNELHREIDPAGNTEYTSIFTQRDEVYSGSEATVFHLVKLFALQQVIHHNLPIVIDSFRAEDLSTGKENIVLKIAKSIKNQMIFTTTLKREELGKYNGVEGINHIDYQPHKPSKILDSSYVREFSALMSQLSIQLRL